MDRTLKRKVHQRAGGRCEYCQLPESLSELPHVVDHVIALQHGGQTSTENLALACGRCNRHKGPNIAGIDPQTAKPTRLFHPRNDRWSDHFEWRSELLIGKSDVGRTTIEVLAINQPRRVALRRVLAAAGQLRLG